MTKNKTNLISILKIYYNQKKLSYIFSVDGYKPIQATEYDEMISNSFHILSYTPA